MAKTVLKPVTYDSLFLIHLFLDPVGIKSPAFSSDSKGAIFNRRAKSDIVLMCQSQGYPVPDHRWDNLYAIIWNNMLMKQ